MNRRRPRTKRASVLLGLAAAVLVPAPAAAGMPDGEALLDHFQNVVFKAESPTPTAKPLYRWVDPIRARLNGDDHGYRRHVEELLGRLSRLTGLPVDLVDAPPYNLEISFLPAEEIRRRFKQPGVRCLGQLSGSKSRAAITQARVFISLESDFRTRHCIVEEITQILGLTNDTKIIADSIFNDASRATALSLADRILVRTLYDPELKPGMTESEARPIARRIIERLLARIEDALANPRENVGRN